MIRLATLLLAMVPLIQGPMLPGPGMPASSGSAPTLTTHNIIQSNSSTVTQASLTVTSNTGGNAIVVFVKWADRTPGHFSSLWDCAGSSACGSSTDTFTQALTCTAGNVTANATMCAYYVCNSALSSGTWTFTLNLTNAAAFLGLEVSTWGNVPTTSCLDASGITAPGGSSANPSVSTGGNVAATNEVAIGGLAATVANPVAAGGYTELDHTGGMSHEYLLNPTSGAVATASWTLATSNFEAGVVVLK